MKDWNQALRDPRCGGYYSTVPCFAQSCREGDVYCEAHLDLLTMEAWYEADPLPTGTITLVAEALKSSDELNKLTPEEYAAKVVHSVIGSDPT